MGPSDIAGKNVKAPIITITPMRRIANNNESVENVPEEGGVTFFSASSPAKARLGHMIEIRPNIITTPKTRL